MGDGSASERLGRALDRLDRRIDWEKRLRVGGWRQGLDPVHDLLRRLGDPHRRPRVVHVAGSKGKGSVAALVEAALLAAGLRAGAYASPHVDRVNERVRVLGRPVADGPLARAIEAALAAVEAAEEDGGAAREASWFDLVTAAAFVVFESEGVDWVALEVGLGGRLDSTNVVPPPEVCVVTSIELEHAAVLGGTRAAIAAEKGGVLKEGCAFVCGLDPADEAGAVLVERARTLGVEPRVVAPVAGESLEARNRALAGAALDALGARGHVGRDGTPLGAGLVEGLPRGAARLPGRLERGRIGGVAALLDGAHTAGSLVRVLAEAAADPALPGPPVVVLAVHREKDPAALVGPLAGRAAAVVCTTLDSGIHHPAAVLADAARAAGLDAEEVPEPAEAARRAAARAGPGGWVLVTGSLYLVGAVRGARPQAAGENGR